MKQNEKAKICFVIHIAGEKKILFYIYFVIVKQKFINAPLITTYTLHPTPYTLHPTVPMPLACLRHWGLVHTLTWLRSLSPSRLRGSPYLDARLFVEVVEGLHFHR